MAAAFYIFLPLQYWLVWTDWVTMLTIAIPVYAFLSLPVLSMLKGVTADYLQRVAKIQWGLMLAVFCISHAPALLMLDLGGVPPVQLLFFLVTVVQMSDVLQYVAGKLFGRHKMAPNVSPSKTWEGLIVGGLAATGVGSALWWITPFSPLEAAGMAFAIVVAGALGGLVLSAVKRSLGAKDWGAMIQGHGGALDRMDSVTFAAPLFFHLTNYFFAR
jgi:phosphatidate cytidylyltransferase